MNIELWQVPLLVIAGVVALESIARLVVRKWRLPTEGKKQVRTIGLALLAIIMFALLWKAWALINTSVTANLVAMVSTLIELGTLWLTYQSYRELQAAKDKSPN